MQCRIHFILNIAHQHFQLPTVRVNCVLSCHVTTSLMSSFCRDLWCDRSTTSWVVAKVRDVVSVSCSFQEAKLLGKAQCYYNKQMHHMVGAKCITKFVKTRSITAISLLDRCSIACYFPEYCFPGCTVLQFVTIM